MLPARIGHGAVGLVRTKDRGLLCPRKQSFGRAVMEISTIGVVGAGQMGNGIAHVCALAGYDVMMTDISEEALTASMALIEKNLARQASRGKISDADMQAALDRIKTTNVLTDLGPSDLII